MRYLILSLSILASLTAAVPASATNCTTICNPQGTFCTTNCI